MTIPIWFYATGAISWILAAWEEINYFWKNKVAAEKVVVVMVKTFLLNLIIGVLIFSVKDLLDALAWQNPFGINRLTYLEQLSRIGTTRFFIKSILTSPPIEEMFFRIGPLWLVQKFTRVSLILWGIVVFSSVIFALLHQQEMTATLYYFVTGFMYAGCYLKTQSKLAPCLLHSGRNFLGFLAML